MADRESGFGRALRSQWTKLVLAQAPAAALWIWTWAGGLAHQSDVDVVQKTVDQVMQAQAADRSVCSDSTDELRAELEALQSRSKRVSEGELEWLVGWHAAQRVPRHRAEDVAKATRKEFRDRLANGEDVLDVALKLLPKR